MLEEVRAELGLREGDAYAVSSKTGAGVAALKDALAAAMPPKIVPASYEKLLKQLRAMAGKSPFVMAEDAQMLAMSNTVSYVSYNWCTRCIWSICPMRNPSTSLLATTSSSFTLVSPRGVHYAGGHVLRRDGTRGTERAVGAGRAVLLGLHERRQALRGARGE